MICDICGENRVVTLSRDIVIEGSDRVLYYCLNCKVRWEVIERV